MDSLKSKKLVPMPVIARKIDAVVETKKKHNFAFDTTDIYFLLRRFLTDLLFEHTHVSRIFEPASLSLPFKHFFNRILASNSSNTIDFINVSFIIYNTVLFRIGKSAVYY